MMHNGYNISIVSKCILKLNVILQKKIYKKVKFITLKNMVQEFT